MQTSSDAARAKAPSSSTIRGHSPQRQPIRRRGLSLRDLDRALARIPQERRQVMLLIGLEEFRMRPRRYSTCRSGRPLTAVTRSRVTAHTDGPDTCNGAGEPCSYHERAVEAQTLRPGI